MNNFLGLFAASLFGNIGFASFWMLQVKLATSTDPTNLLIAGITGVSAALVTVFFIYRKEVKERAVQNELHLNKVQAIYESVVKETNSNIFNNNRLTDENIKQVKELRDAIQRMPNELREALKDRK